MYYNHVYWRLIKSEIVTNEIFVYQLEIYLGKMTYITNRRRTFTLPCAERNSNVKRNPNNCNVKRFSCTEERLRTVWNMGTSKKGFDSWIPRNRRGSSGRRGHIDVSNFICTFKLCVYFQFKLFYYNIWLRLIKWPISFIPFQLSATTVTEKRKNVHWMTHHYVRNIAFNLHF